MIVIIDAVLGYVTIICSCICLIWIFYKRLTNDRHMGIWNDLYDWFDAYINDKVDEQIENQHKKENKEK